MQNLARPLRIFLWSYVFIYAVCCSLSITQVDLWWQLSEGAHIWQTWRLPTQPAVAYGLPATPYFDEYAGYEVVLALLFKLTGFVGLWVTFAAIYLVIIFLPSATTSKKYPSFDLTSTLALLSAVLLIRTRLEQRPELVGALLQVLLMVLLRASTLESVTARKIGWLFLLFVAWTNVHDTFVFGLLTLGLWIASEVCHRSRTAPLPALLRRAAILVSVALLGSVLHPYGPARLLFPFLQASDPAATALSKEMWPITSFSTPFDFYLVALALLAWGIFTTRALPLWLIMFSIFSLVISFKNFRFVDFAAISLLFVYAARNESRTPQARTLPGLVAVPRDLFLALLCLLMLLLDAFNLLSNYDELRSERCLAVHGLRYASDMAEYPAGSTEHRVPVLCDLGMSSYLAFEGHGHFRPLLDSGLSHFSDDTKRYFFFVWYEPEALATALDHLSVDDVLLDWDNFAWIPTLHRLPDWKFVACSANGTIWTRYPGGPHALSADDRAQVADAIAKLMQKSRSTSAFAYSTLLDQPMESMAILADPSGETWNEQFYDSFCAWVDSIPLADIQTFLGDNRCRQAPLLEAVLSARVGPEAYDKFIATHPKDPGPWYWKATEARVLLQKGDRDQARTIFDSISPVPASSTAYYRLWHAVHDGVAGPELSSYGQWQSWNESEERFIEEMSARLNERIRNLDEPVSR